MPIFKNHFVDGIGIRNVFGWKFNLLEIVIADVEGKNASWFLDTFLWFWP